MTRTSARAQHRAKVAIAAAAGAGAFVVGCGGGFVFGDFDFVDGHGHEHLDAVFVFRVRGQVATQDFQVATQSADFVRLARSELQRPAGERRLIVNGRVQRGTGGFNAPWSWHLQEAYLADAQPASCDGLPSQVEANIEAWIARVGRFCPASAFVLSEL